MNMEVNAVRGCIKLLFLAAIAGIILMDSLGAQRPAPQYPRSGNYYHPDDSIYIVLPVYNTAWMNANGYPKQSLIFVRKYGNTVLDSISWKEADDTAGSPKPIDKAMNGVYVFRSRAGLHSAAFGQYYWYAVICTTATPNCPYTYGGDYYVAGNAEDTVWNTDILEHLKEKEKYGGHLSPVGKDYATYIARRMEIAQGLAPGSYTMQRLHSSVDTIWAYDSLGALWAIIRYFHPGKSAGGVPDSTRVDKP
jgi:hypothetical protein